MKQEVDPDQFAKAAQGRPRHVGRWLPFVLLVLLPTLLLALYSSLFASPQYLSTAQFVIRGMQPEPAAPGALGQLLGVGGGNSGAQKEAQSIRAYLRSPDAIVALRARGIDVRKLFVNEEIDFVARLRPEFPTAERLLDHYRDHAAISFSPDDGLMKIAVRAFSPSDARAISTALIELGEQRVNEFNLRAIEAGTQVAQSELEEAEADLQKMQTQLTGFRDLTGDIDPVANSQTALKDIAEQNSVLARERALYRDMSNYLSPSSPQMVAMRSRLEALEIQASASKENTTGQPKALTKRLAQYEELKLRQQFAAKRYEAARTAIENAKLQAAKQRLFLIPIVKPNLPERPDKPRPIRSTLLSFMVLLAAFAIGWLLLAGVREHQA